MTKYGQTNEYFYTYSDCIVYERLLQVKSSFSLIYKVTFIILLWANINHVKQRIEHGYFSVV